MTSFYLSVIALPLIAFVAGLVALVSWRARQEKQAQERYDRQLAQQQRMAIAHQQLAIDERQVVIDFAREMTVSLRTAISDQANVTAKMGDRSIQAVYRLPPAASRAQTKVIMEQEEQPLALPAPVPTFAHLLARRVIHNALSEGKMLIGFTFDAATQQWIPRLGTWLDFYSCAIAGVLGSGKTTTALFLLLQALLAGAKMILIDPHLHEPEESLAERLRMFQASMIFAPCDDTPKEMLDRVRWVTNEFKRRKALGIKGPALIVVFEEFNACMRNPEAAKEIAELLEIVEQEARKFGIFAMLIGQFWSAQGIGGAVIRQCLASALVHRMGDIEQAKKLLGLPQHAKTTLQLEQGHHVFKDTRGGYTETVTPAIDEDDLVEVARLVPGTIVESGLQPVRKQFTEPLQNRTQEPVELESEPTESKPKANRLQPIDDALQARARDIIKLMAQGHQKPEVMKMLWGIAPSKSDAYKKAEAEYLEAMKRVSQILEQESEAN